MRPSTDERANAGDATPRVRALERLLRSGTTEPLNRFAALAARSFGVTTAGFSLVEGGTTRSFAMSGVPPIEAPSETTFSGLVAARDEIVVVPDARAWGGPAATNVLAQGNRAFAGVPIVATDGTRLGVLTIMDARPRVASYFDPGALRAFAAFAARLLEERLDAFAIRSEHDDLRATIADAPTPILTTDATGALTSWNAAAERLYGWTFEEAAAGPMAGVALERRDAVREGLRRVVEDGITIRSAPSLALRADGRQLDVVISAAPRRDLAGAAVGATVIVEDVSAALRRDHLERRRTGVLELAAADAPLPEIVARLADYVEFAIPGAACVLLTRGGDGAIVPHAGPAMPPELRRHVDVATVQANAVRASLAGEASIDVVEAARSAPSSLAAVYLGFAALGYPVIWRQPIGDATGAVAGAVVAYACENRPPSADERRSLVEAASLASIAIESCTVRQRLERLALHDELTGLANRTLLEQRLRRARTDAANGRFAVALIDLDRFKVVNDSLGHAVGDRLLVEIANRLRASVRASDFVARLSGDEFVVVLDGIGDRASAAAVARTLSAAIERRCTPGGHELYVRASIGIALSPGDGIEPADVLRRADEAMYASRAAGTRIGFAERAPDAATPLTLETDLTCAVARGEFDLLYAPAIDASTGDVAFAEALLHWDHPRLGRLSYERFSSIAEQTGLVVEIGRRQLREACRFARRWRAAGGAGVVSVNVSAREFEDRAFVETVAAALAESGVAPSQLWLEITETLIMRSPESAAARLAELRAIGVRSTIDNFGTGYSSLAYLKRFPIDGLKIDRTFVKDLGSNGDAGDRAIVGAIVALGDALGLDVVADGAERAANATALCALGCATLQGPYVARTVDGEALLRDISVRGRSTAREA